MYSFLARAHCNRGVFGSSCKFCWTSEGVKLSAWVATYISSPGTPLLTNACLNESGIASFVILSLTARLQLLTYSFGWFWWSDIIIRSGQSNAVSLETCVCSHSLPFQCTGDYLCHPPLPIHAPETIYATHFSNTGIQDKLAPAPPPSCLVRF